MTAQVNWATTKEWVEATHDQLVFAYAPSTLLQKSDLTHVTVGSELAIVWSSLLREAATSGRHTVSVKSLPSGELLLMPLVIELAKENDECLAEVSELELYAFAETEKDAIAEILEDFDDLRREVAGKDETQLGEKARDWKRIIQSHIAL